MRAYDDTPAAGQFGSPPDPSLVAAARAYIAASRWTFAATMPDIPHWYVVRQRARAAGLGDGHEALYVLIVDYGFERWWRFRYWRSIELDGFLYWRHTDGMVINRRPKDWDV